MREDEGLFCKTAKPGIIAKITELKKKTTRAETETGAGPTVHRRGWGFSHHGPRPSLWRGGWKGRWALRGCWLLTRTGARERSTGATGSSTARCREGKQRNRRRRRLRDSGTARRRIWASSSPDRRSGDAAKVRAAPWNCGHHDCSWFTERERCILRKSYRSELQHAMASVTDDNTRTVRKALEQRHL